MNLNKAKIYLDKINREFARMQRDPETIARIDVDIMLSHIRDLYDACLSESVENQQVATAKQEPMHRPVVQQKVHDFSPERPVAKVPAPKIVVEESTPEPPKPQPVPAPPPAPAPEPARPTVHPETTWTEIPKPVEPPKPVAPPPPPVQEEKPPVAHRHHHSHAATSSGESDALFEQKQARELSEKLAERPIEDLKKGIALNDRLLFIRELFGGDNSVFDTTLNSLNSFSNFENAKAYLEDHCVNRFDWLHKSRMERAKEFIRLVRRRYK